MSFEGPVILQLKFEAVLTEILKEHKVNQRSKSSVPIVRVQLDV